MPGSPVRIGLGSFFAASVSGLSFCGPSINVCSGAGAWILGPLSEKKLRFMFAGMQHAELIQGLVQELS